MVVESIAKENIENEKKESKEVAQKNAQILKELDKPLNAKDIKETKMVKDISKSQLKGLDKPLNAKNEVRQNVDTSNYSNKDIKNYDNSGNLYRVGDELIPNNTYEINGISYETDSAGRITSWDGEPGYNPDAERDGEAQTDAGGKDRKLGDDGGHLVARILNGSSGTENIVAMRDTINRGDYKKSENEIAEAKKPPAEKEVRDSGKVLYDGDSKRPSKIERTYTIDGVTKELTVDNVEGSKDLLDSIENNISETDFQSIEERITDMEEDGAEVSVTSVLKEYDEAGGVTSVTVGIRDEISKTKTYIKFEGR